MLGENEQFSEVNEVALIKSYSVFEYVKRKYETNRIMVIIKWNPEKGKFKEDHNKTADRWNTVTSKVV